MSEQRNAERDREIIADVKRLQGDGIVFTIADHWLERAVRAEKAIVATREIYDLVEQRAVAAEQRVAELERKLTEAVEQIEYMRDNIPNELWNYKEYEQWGNQADEVIQALKGGTE